MWSHWSADLLIPYPRKKLVSWLIKGSNHLNDQVFFVPKDKKLDISIFFINCKLQAIKSTEHYIKIQVKKVKLILGDRKTYVIF